MLGPPSAVINTADYSGVSTSMERPRGLVLATYLVGGTLTVLPLLDAWLSVSPFHMEDVRWRFGAAGLAANSLLLPSAGLLLLLAAAIVYGHTVFRRVLGVVALVAALACSIGVILFVLDAVQTRPEVRPGMSASFLLASSAAAVKMLIAVVTFFAVGRAGVDGMRAKERARPTPPLVGLNQVSRS